MSGPVGPAGSMPALPPTRQPVAGDVADLLTRVAQGDHAAFVALYHRTVARVLGLVTLMLGDTAMAEDVTAAVYQELPRTAAQYDPTQGSAHAWLMGLAHRHAAACLRARRGPAASSADTAAAQLAPLRPIPLPAALERLDASSRELIMLIYYRGYTVVQAANLLGLPAATAGSRLRTALRTLSQESMATGWHES